MSIENILIGISKGEDVSSELGAKILEKITVAIEAKKHEVMNSMMEGSSEEEQE